jgi:hypothetical protein
VADTFNNRVKGFNPSGSLIFNTNTDLNLPRGFAIVDDPFNTNGSLTVTNTGNGNIATYRDNSFESSNLPGFFTA